jgi:serine kinase of HPr protein (carbohydrate metabolism regulator)
MPDILHATLVARWIEGCWRGALIRGASGAGKSTVALRCLDAGFRLVADDRVVAFASGGRLFGKPPTALAGLIEVRGVGVVAAEPTLPLCEIALVVDLERAVERFPEPAELELEHVRLPRLALPFADVDLPLRLAAALAALQRGL